MQHESDLTKISLFKSVMEAGARVSAQDWAATHHSW